MQAAFQQYCDAAVSKTINLNEKASVSAIERAYKLAYKLGCKGITVYRQHSRKYQPMSLY
jgi:ribonucleoside-diphosphate reductase alpha chain